MEDRQIKNIIFDWHGVISDDKLSFFHCVVNNMLREYGVKKLSLNELKKNWETPYMRFFNKYIPEMTLKEERKSYKKAALLCPAQKPCEGMVDLLHKFKSEKINMVILSSDPYKHIVQGINRFGLNDVFNEIVGDVHDKSEVVIDLIKKNGFDAGEIIFIGDTVHETEVGKIAGIKTGAVTWGLQNKGKLKNANPDFVINNPKDLEAIILGK